MCRAVAVTFRDSLCDTFNVSNEYKSLLRPGDLLAPRDCHRGITHSANTSTWARDDRNNLQHRELERRFAWMWWGERRRGTRLGAGVPPDIIPLTRLLIADISLRPRHYCQWTHQPQCCQQQRRRGHCHANTRSISCADLVLIQIPSTVTTGSRLRRTLRAIKTAIIPLWIFWEPDTDPGLWWLPHICILMVDISCFILKLGLCHLQEPRQDEGKC